MGSLWVVTIWLLFSLEMNWFWSCPRSTPCSYAVYKYTARGLFERHKLLLSLQMCIRILQVSSGWWWAAVCTP